jgi:hypothetical protein
MAKAQSSEIFSLLKSYARKISDGERTPAEIGAALNDWAHESGATLKSRIQDEVEAAVHRMGFVKREEFDALKREVASLKKAQPRRSPVRKSPVRKSPVKKSSAKKSGVKR